MREEPADLIVGRAERGIWATHPHLGSRPFGEGAGLVSTHLVLSDQIVAITYFGKASDDARGSHSSQVCRK